MSTGRFINFCVPYMENGIFISSDTQAEEILTKAQELIDNGAIGVAITYSANYGQTLQIEKTYAAGGWDTDTNGANQAAVMSAMESMMGSSWQALQGKMRIAPITTMNAYVNPVTPWDDTVLMNIVTTDLNRIGTYLQDGWCILGWQNQDTVKDAQHPYAVGGSIAHLPAAVSDAIQQTLIGFSQQYPG